MHAETLDGCKSVCGEANAATPSLDALLPVLANWIGYAGSLANVNVCGGVCLVHLSADKNSPRGLEKMLGNHEPLLVLLCVQVGLLIPAETTNISHDQSKSVVIEERTRPGFIMLKLWQPGG
jgi:hypothetical protein